MSLSLWVTKTRERRQQDTQKFQYSMVTIKKKRSYNTKSARVAAAQQAQRMQEQQKQHLQAKHHFEDSRLKSESQISSTVHDESDSISFRGNILKNFINSTSYMNALTLKPVPLSRLQPASMYGPPKVAKQSLIDMENKLNKELEQLSSLKEELKTTEDLNTDPNQTLLAILDISSIDQLDISSLDSIDTLLDKYKKKYKLISQDHIVVKRIDEFIDLKLDKSEAPPEYWEIYNDLKQKQKERKELEIKLALERKMKEEEEERSRKEAERLELLFTEKQEREKLDKEEKERLAKEMEQKLSQEQDIIRQQAQQDIVADPVIPLPAGQMPTTVFAQDIDSQINPAGILSASIDTNSASNILGVVDDTPSVNPTIETTNMADTGEGQELLDDMFGQYNNDQFNNGFDDEFEDLDNVFF